MKHPRGDFRSCGGGEAVQAEEFQLFVVPAMRSPEFPLERGFGGGTKETITDWIGNEAKPQILHMP